MKFDDTLEAFEAMLVVVVYAFEMQPTFCLILQTCWETCGLFC